jgi:hypothetical protein
LTRPYQHKRLAVVAWDASLNSSCKMRLAVANQDAILIFVVPPM